MFQQKEGKSVDLSQGIVVHSLSSAAGPSLQVTSTAQGVGSTSPSCQSQPQAIHNLEVDGQSFMISTPGAPAVDIDFGVSAVQINRSAPNGPTSVSNANSAVANGTIESMNISPRAEQMDE